LIKWKLYVAVDNPRAASFTEFGFESYGVMRVPCGSGADFDALMMVKKFR